MHLNEPIGKTFSIAAENAPVALCTVSKAVWQGGGIKVSHFALAAETEISAESYWDFRLCIVAKGSAEAFSADRRIWKLGPGMAFASPQEIPVGIRSQTGCVYTEITFQEETKMQNINAGEIFTLKDMLPYQEGKIINKDIVSSERAKLAVMSFGAGTALAEHAAPGEAILTALDGEATITYEGTEHRICAGQSFAFAKNGRHAVRAETNFKMALLLLLSA